MTGVRFEADPQLRGFDLAELTGPGPLVLPKHARDCFLIFGWDIYADIIGLRRIVIRGHMTFTLA